MSRGMLSEKELQQIILDSCCWSQRIQDSPEKLWYAKAAHAIAEKMAKGVVWQKVGEAHVDYGKGVTEVIFKNGGRWSSITVADTTLEELDGQRVTVTVTKEE